ncbi:MAG TPA: heme exporter protein CcmD [Kiloniellales bacterium]|nr:heme exporter protein CcmD [Kiloniellales bacterium]
MSEIESFFAMGGYGAFVWPAFGLTAVVLIGLLVDTLGRLRARERALAKWQAAGGTARPRRGAPKPRQEATPES